MALISRSQDLLDNYQERIKKLVANGVPDTRWCSLLLYFLEAKEYSHLKDDQKEEVVELLTSVVSAKTYSEEALNQVLRDYRRIITGPYQKQVEDLVREASHMLTDFHNITQSRYRKIEALETEAVNIIGEYSDNDALIDRLRQAFVGVKEQLRKDVEILEAMAFRDTLTNIGNRRAFDSFLEHAVPRWKEQGVPLGLAIFDVDHFKHFNDCYGHSIGDQVLKLIAKHLGLWVEKLEKANNQAIAIRYGGEEFLLVLSGPDARHLPDIANELCDAIRNFNFILRDNTGNVLESGLQVTVSAGVAVCRADWEDCGAMVLEYADKALYEAKVNGRHRVYTFSPKAKSGFRLVESKPKA